MSCIWNTPKEERHCEYCLALCDERPPEPETIASNKTNLCTFVLQGKEFYIINGKLIEKTLYL